jgi:hypothetical protein
MVGLSLPGAIVIHLWVPMFPVPGFVGITPVDMFFIIVCGKILISIPVLDEDTRVIILIPSVFTDNVGCLTIEDHLNLSGSHSSNEYVRV